MARISNLDFYAILGVHPNAEDIVIRAAFKALAQRYHPDRFNGSSDEAHRRMADLTNAYETLSDPARRRKYDRRRGLSARTATFYFKNPARDKQPGFGALAARAALAKQRKYRAAVYVLMTAVVILSAFNIRQHSTQIREFFASSRAAPTPAAEARAGPPSAISTPSTSDTAAPTPGAPASTAGVRILPVGQGATRPIGSNAVENPAPVARVADTPVSAPPSEPVNAARIAPHPVAAASGRGPVALAAEPAAREVAGKDTKRGNGKPQAARTAQPDPARSTVAKAAQPARPAPTARSAANSEACKDAVAALGLCNKSSAPKE